MTALAYGQLPSSTVNGRVTDLQGARVISARVTITNNARGSSRETLTNAEGLYVFPSLEVGTYDLKVESPSFAITETHGITLEAGRIQTIDVSLHPASANAVINVSEVNDTVNLSQSMIQGQINSKTIESIPLNGRNFLELAYLVPGNRPAPTFDPTKTNTLEVSSAGGFGRGGNITVDGGDNNDEVVGGTLSNFPADSVKEFQIATARFTSEVGRSGNSIVNIVTKGGTNSYHGTLFFFLRNRNLQALPATFDRSLPTPPFDRQQYGGSIGGPIRKDKAWFFHPLSIATKTQPSRPERATSPRTRSSTPPPRARYATLSGLRDTISNSVLITASWCGTPSTAPRTPAKQHHHKPLPLLLQRSARTRSIASTLSWRA